MLDQPRAVVGRSRRCDFVVEDPNMSRRHFELQQRGDDWYVVDLESTNGIAVNGRRVPSAQLAAGRRDRGRHLPHAVQRGLRSAPLSDPIEVLLQFAFLGVLYLFLLWVARSALRDLGRPATELGRVCGRGAGERRAAVLGPAGGGARGRALERARRSVSGPGS